MTESQGRAVLKRCFEAAGLLILEDQHLSGAGYDVVADGWEAARRIGYEYITVEAGDPIEFNPTALAALEAENESGALSLLLVDEHDVGGEAELALAAERFLAELRTRGRL